MTINDAVSNILMKSKECKTCEPTVIKHSSIAPIPLPKLYRSRSFLFTSTLLSMAGLGIYELNSVGSQAQVIRAYQTMMEVDRAEVEIRSVQKNGEIFDRKIVLVKAYDENQQFVGHYSFTQDISSCREVDRLKDEFVSVVSHELRIPLTSIAGALDIVSSGILQREHLTNAMSKYTEARLR